MLVLWFFIYIICYLLTFFAYWNLQKIENWNEQVTISICILGMNYFWYSFSNILILCIIPVYHVMLLFSFILSRIQKKYLKTKCEISKWFWNKVTNFRRRILLRVTLVFVKESLGIRISLNIMRSTQIFNEILYKSLYLS